MTDGLYHYLGLSYEDGKEKVVWHQTRMCRDDLHASQILDNMSMSFGSKVGCINMMTDAEYKQWKESKE